MQIYKATSTLDGYLPELDYTSNPNDADVILIGGKKIVLSDFPKLKGIFKTGVGTDNLPFALANERGVRIALPSASTCETIYEETAAFTCHLILTGLYAGMGDWSTWNKVDRPMTSQQNLLVLGMGRIGGRVAKKMGNFMQVCSFDTAQQSQSELEPLIRTADVISLHIPLVAETRGSFDATKMSWMKDGALLVNTARGPIVDEEALYGALRDGKIRAAFDVFWQEPYAGKLMEFAPDRFRVTPHVASTCREFLEGCSRDFLEFQRELTQRR